ncbi:MAG: carboxypeptidase-like regulatory domain-containing protein [Sphingobacteriales bacterium]
MASYLKSHRYQWLFSSVFLLLCHFSAFSQSTLQAELLKCTNRTDSVTNKYPAEKIYIQFDKPDYALGDTVWLKAYLFNAPSLLLSAQSGILHIDITNDSNKLVKQYQLPVARGITWASIGLDKKDFLPGNYILRAYTNWMRNFGDETFFYKQFSILSLENKLLVTSNINISALADHDKINTILKFTDANTMPVINAPMQLQVFAGEKRLYKQKLVTDDKGILNVNFEVPPKTANIHLIAEDEKQPGKMLIPINMYRAENADIRFLPEGGSLVAGIPAHIGFKAVGEDGKGLDISGAILDKQGKQIASINSLHKGIGSFDLDVQPDEVYTAKITFSGGAFKSYPLPAIKNSGTALRIVNNPDRDSLDVIVSATGDIAALHQNYFLTAKARGVVCYAATLDFNKMSTTRCKIAKSLFPTGITHFVLMTTAEQPLNERLVFIDHADALNITIAAKPEYAVKDSIALHISVNDNAGKPVQGNFSLAVTDDSQVKQDSLVENIASRLLLTSDLKGYVEQPAYYFSSANPDRFTALDNLLLTQGWVSYELKTAVAPYTAEHEFKVSGKVTNVFNKAVKGTRVMLLSQSPTIVKDTLTDNNGRFVFDNFPKIDTPVFVVEAVNKSGKSFNVRITMDEPIAPGFTNPYNPIVMPWYVNSDTTLLSFIKNDTRAKELQYFPEGGHTLNEVKIAAKKIIKDSYNLNGQGTADQVIDEKELEHAGKKTILDVLQERVTGFNEGCVRGYCWYRVKYKWVYIIIDGTPIFKVVNIQDFDDFRRYLQSHTAEDIKGIEVIFADRYTAKYETIFRHRPGVICYIEITTRSGHGPLMDNTPGVYLYKPIAVSYPKQFYKPKYALTDTVKQIDLRSTIDWEPNVATDSLGKATVSFYTATQPSAYSVILEGTDMAGNIGYKRIKVKVVGRRETQKSK